MDIMILGRRQALQQPVVLHMSVSCLPLHAVPCLAFARARSHHADCNTCSSLLEACSASQAASGGRQDGGVHCQNKPLGSITTHLAADVTLLGVCVQAGSSFQQQAVDEFCCCACMPTSQLAVHLLQALLRLTLSPGVPCRQQGGQEGSQQDRDGQLHWECQRAPLLQGCLPHCAAWGECGCSHLVPSGASRLPAPCPIWESVADSLTIAWPTNSGRPIFSSGACELLLA